MSFWDRKTAIILPTFNESQNLQLLLTKLHKVAPHSLIIIVDDSNPFENKKIKKIVSVNKWATLINRNKKLGRGSAVMTGFKEALKKKRIEFFIEMDTDLSHDPKEIPILFNTLKQTDAKLVIGSRYIKKSKIINWPMKRLIPSKIINFFLNLWLGIKLHDYTNGFRLYHRAAVEHLIDVGLKEKNFIALSESAFLVNQKGYKIVEAPITFTDRTQGESSVGTKELFLSLLGALRIRSYYSIVKMDILLALLLFTIAFAVRLPLYHTDYFKTPDAIEYINVAKNINEGQGLTQSIKWHFFSNSPVITSAFEGKPFFSSIVFAPILYFLNDVYYLQLFLFFVTSVTVVLFYYLCRNYLSAFYSFLASFLFAINPNILISNRLILSEPIFYFLVLSALVINFSKIRSNTKFSILGLLIGLAYLTRNEGLILLLTMIIFNIRQFKNVLNMIFFFFLVTAPFLYANFITNGNPLFSYNIYHFRVHHFIEGMSMGYGKTFPATGTFVQENLSWIINQIVYRFLTSLQSLIDFTYFGLIAVSAVFIFSRKVMSKFALFFFFSVLILINFSVIWSSFVAPERHFSLVYILLLLPLFYAIQTTTKKRKVISLLLVAITISIYGVYDAHRINWARNYEKMTEPWSIDKKGKLYAAIKEKTPPNAIIASTGPHFVYLNTDRPSVILPQVFHDEKMLNKFIKEYNVSYIIFDSAKFNYSGSSTIYSDNEGKLVKVK